jgi:hypothetical protein
MSEEAVSVILESESSDLWNVHVVAVKPTWRDVWAILRGSYVPRVRRVRRFREIDEAVEDVRRDFNRQVWQ